MIRLNRLHWMAWLTNPEGLWPGKGTGALRVWLKKHGLVDVISGWKYVLTTKGHEALKKGIEEHERHPGFAEIRTKYGL